MFQKVFYRLVLFAFLLTLTACNNDQLGSDTILNETNDVQERELERFSDFLLGAFDTLTVVTGYANSQDEFDYFTRIIHSELKHLHQLFDIFNEYPDINNLRTVNNNAGIAPVEVDPIIIELIQISKQAYHDTNGTVNIAFGPVLSIWHYYRTFFIENIEDPDIIPTLPSMESLLIANEFTNISDIVVNEEDNTVFLRYENMSLDVGAIAKGFAIEIATLAVLDAGFEYFVISVGGDVSTAQGPRSGVRDTWAIGVQNPIDELADIQPNVDVIYMTNASVFSSGNYQRFFIVDGVPYGHILDTRTLMPSDNFGSVTIIHPSAVVSDILSTAAFIAELDEAKDIVTRLGGEAIWILHDGSIVTTDGYKEFSREFGR